MVAAAHASREAEESLKRIAEGVQGINKEVIERQLAIDPRSILEKLFDGTVPIAQTQVVLQRLFPRIALVDKPSRFTSIFEISCIPGSAFAHASGTGSLEDEVVTVRVKVTTGPKRPVQWQAVLCEAK